MGIDRRSSFGTDAIPGDSAATLAERRIEGVRTLFVSDLHLGSKHSKAAAFLELLSRFRPERLYLVGDIVDGWRLKRRWRWTPLYGQVVSRLMTLGREGTRIYYAPGNHDEFLRPFAEDLGFVRIADEFTHVSADGRRFLVTHGDLYDGRESDSPIRRATDSFFYDSLLALNPALSEVGRWMRRGDASSGGCFSASFKFRFRRAVAYVERFERRLAEEARSRRCDGVVCGHVHVPALSERDGIVYCNTGDWLEHSTAIVEDHAGALTLLVVEPQRESWVVRRTATRAPAGSGPLRARSRAAFPATYESADDELPEFAVGLAEAK